MVKVMIPLEPIEAHLSLLHDDKEKEKLLEFEKDRLLKKSIFETMIPFSQEVTNVNFIDDMQDIRIRAESI